MPKTEKVSPIVRRIMSRRAYALGALALLEKVTDANQPDIKRVPYFKAIFSALRKEIETRYARERQSGVIAE